MAEGERAMSEAAYARRIEDHYAMSWSSPIAAIRWDEGPAHELPADFRVLLMMPSSERAAYGTICMSQPGDADALELHLFCRPQETELTHAPEILTTVAHYHRNGSTLGLGHSVNFGKPWVPGSSCTHGLLSLPYLDGPTLEWLESPRVRFLWLIPVTPAEVAFKKEHGLEALEQRFEEEQFNYLDPFRRSVV